jgi:hypothetical protein
LRVMAAFLACQWRLKNRQKRRSKFRHIVDGAVWV